LSEDILQRTFFRSPASEPALPAAESAKPVDQPRHYKVLSISLYLDDLRRLDAMVADLKRRGHTKANRSQLIRYALNTVDLDDFPPGV
jgi:hypothetical protein